MKIRKEILVELKGSLIWVIILFLLYILFYRTTDSASNTMIALPFIVILYFIFFSIGKIEVIAGIRKWIDDDFRKVLIIPLLLIFLYVLYLLLNGQNPAEGTIALIPYLIIFPLIIFLIRRHTETKITWIDFVSLVVYLLLTYFIKVNPEGNLPYNGSAFDSMYRIFLMVIAVYVFSTIRGLNDVGFYPVFKAEYLFTAIWVWLVFYLFVIIVGYSVDFVKVIGHEETGWVMFNLVATTLIGTFFHTAIFEELFFRGILQNMLSRRIGQSVSWKVFWKWGLAILIPFAFLVGYTLEGKMQWFPALIVVVIFASAFLIENKNRLHSGVYTSLAITSSIFGLVHYHSGAIIYIGFACVAGWAYGYTYIKTGNVFYSALVHTLVNSSVIIFGLEFLM